MKFEIPNINYIFANTKSIDFIFVMANDSIEIRLKLFLEHLGISSSQFADRCGIPRPSVSQILSGRNKKISNIFINQVHDAFPELSIQWLLFGEGDMLVSGIAKNADENSEFIINPTEEDNYSKEIEKSEPLEMSRDRLNTGVSDDVEAPISKIEIAKNSVKPKKLVRITVYYDDSTFENFYPGPVE